MTKVWRPRIRQDGFLDSAQSGRFLAKVLAQAKLLPKHPPLNWRERQVARLRQRWHRTRVWLAWQVLCGRSPSELHDDCCW